MKTANGMPRPWLVEFCQCQHVRLEGVTLKDSPMWTLVLRNCSEVLIDQVNVTAPIDSPNTDGIDIVSCHKVLIKNTTVFTGDDNIAIKSGINQDGSDPSTDIEVVDSLMQAGHGLSIGSETANGIGTVRVKGVRFAETENGIRIKSARDRGNMIGPLVVENVVMHKVQTPILVTCSYAGQSGVTGLSLVSELEREPTSPTTPYIKGVHIKGLKATRAQYAAVLSGLPESPVLEVELEDLHIESTYGVQARYMQGSIAQANITVKQGEAIVRGPQAQLTEL